MKKTALNKLHLNASTIRQLTGSQLGSVNGGISGHHCETTPTVTERCEPSLQNTACDACGYTQTPSFCMSGC